MIEQSNHTLICFPATVTGDGLATSLGLARALEAMRPEHRIDIACAGFHDAHQHRYRFLPGIERITTRIHATPKLTIRIPHAPENVIHLEQETTPTALEIHLQPDGMPIAPEHIEASLSARTYDCIIVIDCPNLAALGSLFTDHATLFQSTPILTIDRSPEHERYGHAHLIDLTAAACGEVASNFLREVAPEQLTADVATCFLTGIIAATRGFRTARMGPQTFTVVADLLARDARREEIVAALFQTKSIPQLQLWGRALARLRTDTDRRLAWTVLAQHDFLSSGTTAADLTDLIDDLLANAPEAELVLLLTERSDRSIDVTLAVPHNRHDAATLLQPLDGVGSAKLAHTHLPPQELVRAERTVIELLRQRVEPRH